MKRVEENVLDMVDWSSEVRLCVVEEEDGCVIKRGFYLYIYAVVGPPSPNRDFCPRCVFSQ